MKYNMKELTMDMDVVIVSPQEAKRERFATIGISKAQFKNAIFKYYYLNDFFQSSSLRVCDLALLERGISPMRTNKIGQEETIFTIHHIVPVHCGGKTITSNLVPLPREFHNFIHRYVLDEQVRDVKVGTQMTIKGAPNFSKITLEMMEDPIFKMEYQKFLVDEYKIYPPRVLKIHRSRYDRKKWYNQYFKSLER